MGTHPPRPRLTLRIGITGHRPGGDRFAPAQLPAIEQVIGILLADVKSALQRVQQNHADLFAAEPPLLRLVSPLAEGADRAAARAALSRDIDLQCPLPFARSEYERDFRDAATRHEFESLLTRASAAFELPGDRSQEARAYETVGLVVLRQSDLLIAVWDGNLKATRRGGTAEIVAEAFDAGIPVIWISPNDPLPRLADKQTLPAGTSLWEIASTAPVLNTGRLADLIAALCAPPPEHQPHVEGPSSSARQRLIAFYKERVRRGPTIFIAYRLLLRLFGGIPSRESDAGALDNLIGTASFRESEPIGNFAHIWSLLRPRYGWADHLSLHLGQIYRSGYIMNFGLAAFAVFFALLGLIYLPERKPVWAFLELVLISAVLLLTWLGVNRRWHDRWIDCRQLAEQLRHLRFLALTGSPPNEARALDVAAEPGPAWVNWYCRATLRELSLPNASVGKDYIALLRATLAEEISDQRGYHHVNNVRLHNLHHWLDRFGLLGFSLTFAVCFLFVIGSGFIHLSDIHTREFANHLATFLGGTLPAFGAAFYAIRVQGEFKLAAARSAATAARLRDLGARLASLSDPSFAQLAGIADEAAAVMGAELSGWSVIFRSKPISLPA